MTGAGVLESPLGWNLQDGVLVFFHVPFLSLHVASHRLGLFHSAFLFSRAVEVFTWWLASKKAKVHIVRPS